VAVANCFYNKEKRFAFIEIATVEEAAKCMESLDGVSIGGSEVKITRPQDYHQPSGLGLLQPSMAAPMFPAPGMLGMPGMMNPMQQQMMMQQQQQALLQMQLRQQQMQQAAAMQASQMGQMGVGTLGFGTLSRPGMMPGMAPLAAKPTITFEAAMELSKNARVIQFGSVPADAELQAGLAAFLNELYKALKLNTVGGDSVIEAIVDAEAKTALVEFRTVKEAAAAKATLNGVEYGPDNKLTVETAPEYAELTPEESKQCLGNGVLGMDGDAPPKGSTLALAQAAAAAAVANRPMPMGMLPIPVVPTGPPPPVETAATEVVVLSNLFSEAELLDPEEASDILEDTKDKAAEYGEVKGALVVRQGEGGDAGTSYVGLTLVRFAESAKAFAAAKALHGLKFDGRPVAAKFATIELFEAFAADNSVTIKMV